MDVRCGRVEESGGSVDERGDNGGQEGVSASGVELRRWNRKQDDGGGSNGGVAAYEARLIVL